MSPFKINFIKFFLSRLLSLREAFFSFEILIRLMKVDDTFGVYTCMKLNELVLI